MDVVVDARSLPADLGTVDALARLQRAARGYGCHVRLRGASRELHELIGFMGLENVLTD